MLRQVNNANKTPQLDAITDNGTLQMQQILVRIMRMMYYVEIIQKLDLIADMQCLNKERNEEITKK